MKLEDKNFEEEFVKWLNNKTEKELVEGLEKYKLERGKKMREIAKAIGMKNYIVYLLLLALEILINLPFNIIKAVLYPFHYIYFRYFDTEYFFALTRIKRINLYGQELQKKLEEYRKNKK